MAKWWILTNVDRGEGLLPTGLQHPVFNKRITVQFSFVGLWDWIEVWVNMQVESQRHDPGNVNIQDPLGEWAAQHPVGNDDIKAWVNRQVERLRHSNVSN